MLATDGGALPLEESTKAFRLLKLEEGESVTAVVGAEGPPASSPIA
jgi:hypothetical protein